MRSSTVVNLGGSDPFWYHTMSLGVSCPMEPSLVVVEGSDRASESGYEVGSSVVFSLGGPGLEVVSAEGGLIRDSLPLESSG